MLRVTRKLPQGMRLRAIVGSSPVIVDLAVPVDPERDHIRGPEDAAVTLLEYGDLECPFCGQAETVIRELLRDFGDLRYVWRHLPLNDVHPQAQIAAEASEAAGRPGPLLGDARCAALPTRITSRSATWSPRPATSGSTSSSSASTCGSARGWPQIAEDVESADMSGVSGTPSFFINGHRHQGAYDIDTLSKAVRLARARSVVSS